MTDNLAKYEALANTLCSGETRITLKLRAATAIAELVAMVREARELNKMQHQLIQEQLKRAEAAEKELAELRPQPTPKEIAVAARAHEPTFECSRCHSVSYTDYPWCGHEKCPNAARGEKNDA